MPRGRSKSKPRAASKSPGRGRKAKSPAAKSPAAKSPAASPVKAAPAVEMDFSEGDSVMARWPGTSLFYKAKVTFVRPEDGEYDVQYEDGTVYTQKAKDVTKSDAFKRARSRSRGRSPARRKSPARKAAETPKSAAKPKATPTPKPKATPNKKVVVDDTASATRRSSRLEARAALAELSADEDDGAPTKKTKPAASFNPLAYLRSLSFQWVGVLLMAALGPLVMLSLHSLCKGGVCKPALPVLSKNWKSYWDRDAFFLMMGYGFFLRLTSFIPVGATVKALSGREVRMNGFFTLLLCLAIMPVLVYRKVSLQIVSDKYYFLMTSNLLLAFICAAVSLLMSRWGKKSNVNPRGNTGNLIVDFFYGREMNPNFGRCDVKLQVFRFSMTTLALLNIVLVYNHIVASKGDINATVVVASAFQLLYAFDALFFEEYYLQNFDALNNGCGYQLISGYCNYPFLTTLITQYLIATNVVLPWYCLATIALINAFGYVIFRTSENLRCEFAKGSAMTVETISGAGGKKILVSGFWGFVRHPTILGEILIQWSWLLPAVGKMGKVDLLLYFFTIAATIRCLSQLSEVNKKNKRKFGSAWDNYCERVKSNLIPKVY